MKWIIRGAIALSAVLVAVIVVATVLLATLDPNDYKDRITKAAENATGRHVEITGNISVSFFPVLGFRIAGVKVGNPHGYENKNFLTVAEAQAGVKPLPLLHNKVDISKIILDQPVINVVRQPDGSTNLAFNKPKKNEKASQEVTGKPGGERREINVGKIEINDARVTYTDKVTGRNLIIDPLDMTLPGFRPGEETKVSLNMAMKTNEPSLTLKMSGSATARATPAQGTYAISNLETNLSAQTPSFGEPLKASVRGGGKVNLQDRQFSLNVENFKADWQDTSLSGKGEASGSLSSPKVTFSAQAPSLNIDTLRATLGNKRTPDESSGDGQLVPVKLIRGLTMTGHIQVGELIVSELHLTNLAADLDAENGKLNIAPIKGGFYGGAIDSAFLIDATAPNPAFLLKGAASNVDIGSLLQDKLGQDYVTGRANVNYDLSSRGNTLQAMSSAAGGAIGFDLGEGAINKWELSRRINQAIAFFQTGKLAETGLPEHVQFTSLQAMFKGDNGIFRNDDLMLTGPQFHARGAGTVSLASRTADYTLRVGLGETAGEGAREIPVRIYGPFATLNYGIDVQAAVGEFAGKKIRKKEQEFVGKALEKFGGKERPAPQTGGDESIEPSAGEEKENQNTPGEQLLKGLFGH